MAQYTHIRIKNSLPLDSSNAPTTTPPTLKRRQGKGKYGQQQQHGKHQITRFHRKLCDQDVESPSSSFNSYSLLHKMVSSLSSMSNKIARTTKTGNYHHDNQLRHYSTTGHDNHNNNTFPELKEKGASTQGLVKASSFSFSVSASSDDVSSSCTTSTKTTGTGMSHVDSKGKASMVDVSEKKVTTREAVAEATVNLSSETFEAVANNKMKKGDVLTVAQIAGIMGAKHTSNLIPLCHPLPLNKVDVNLELNEERKCVVIQALAKTTAMTGVEMEALTAATIAALTIYDMCKAMGHCITITDVRLIKKSGGKSDYAL